MFTKAKSKTKENFVNSFTKLSKILFEKKKVSIWILIISLTKKKKRIHFLKIHYKSLYFTNLDQIEK